MKEVISYRKSKKTLLFLWLLVGWASGIFAEGSADFVFRPGYRLHLDGSYPQQFKVFAKPGEFINVGSSILHHGGQIRVFTPSGVLTATFDVNSSAGGEALINNLNEEIAGPVGQANGGFTPGVVGVPAGQGGIWTVVFTSANGSTVFPVILNSFNWVREVDQKNALGIIAWDVTVSKNQPADQGGQRLKGRLFTQELATFIREAGRVTSPLYYILTNEGFQYKMDVTDLDPVNFRLSSNNVGVVQGPDKAPYYKSLSVNNYTISADYDNWNASTIYLYEPQAQDKGRIVNNKIFFNPPNADLPATALVTDVTRSNTHTTWLLRAPSNLNVSLGGFTLTGIAGMGQTCLQNVLQQGLGGIVSYTSDKAGLAELCLDINNNGSYADPIDRRIYGYADPGQNSLTWDGKNGLGQALGIANDLSIPYKLNIRVGAMHVLYWDVENSGGFSLTRLVPAGGADADAYLYDHSDVNGAASGGGSAGNPMPTNVMDAYINFWGEDKLLNYWKNYALTGSLQSTLVIDIVSLCGGIYPDSDGDESPDHVDLDDDNDGVPDVREFCNALGGSFACLPGGLDPSGDADDDFVPNFLDKNDPSLQNPCTDADNDGVCDALASIFDHDGDGVADHLDLDSDNDGISDLTEAAHNQADANGDGQLDGPPAAFGPNGLFDALDSDPNSLNSTANYPRADFDNDGVPDFDDLDTDNDGINDVAEAGFALADSNNDGRMDDGAGNPPNVGTWGLPALVDPAVTGQPMPQPTSTDGDNAPDFRDLDSDADGIFDVMEGGAADPDFNGTVGAGNPAVNDFGQAAGASSEPTNTDGDAAPDFQELDSDNDTLSDSDECPSGTPCANGDSDQAPDFQDIDRDDDGIRDDGECETNTPCTDTDSDGTPDLDDLDSDNDGLADADECPGGAPCQDSDGDNVPDFRQFDCNVAVPGGLPQTAALTLSATICAGENVVFTAQNTNLNLIGPVNFTWSGPNGYAENGFLTDVSEPISIQIDQADPLQSGTYTLVIAGANACPSVPLDFEMTVNPRPDVLTISNLANPPCLGNAVELNASIATVPATYDWFLNGDSIASTALPTLSIAAFSGANEGDYTVLANAAGCKSTLSAAVNVQLTLPPVALTAANSSNGLSLCAGATVQFSLPDIPGATYAWSGPGGFSSNLQNPAIDPAEPANSGDYAAVVTLNGCDFQSSATNLSILPNPETPVLSMIGGVCLGGSINLTTQAASGNSTWEWLFDNGNGLESLGMTNVPNFSVQNFSSSKEGDYFALLTTNGCLSNLSAGLTVNLATPPVPIVASNSSANNPVCVGGSVQLSLPNIAGATILWSGPGGFSSTLQNPSIAGVSQANAGDYSAQVTTGGCTFTSTATTVQVADEPAAPMLTTSNQPCFGGTTTLTALTSAGPNATFDWYFDNGNGPTLFNTTPLPTLTLSNFSTFNEGDYFVLVNANGCDSDASIGVTLEIVQPSVPLNASNSTNGSPVCAGTPVQLSLPDVFGATYLWSGPGGFSSVDRNPNIPAITLDGAGSYSALVTLQGCTFPSTSTLVSVLASPPQPVLQAQSPVCPGEAMLLSVAPFVGNNVSYEWFFNGQSLGSTSMPNFTVNNFSALNVGNYAVMVRAGACQSAISAPVNLQLAAPPQALNAGNSTMLGPACEGESVQLSLVDIPGASYVWNGPGGFTSMQSNPLIAAVTTANIGLYSAQVTIGGCTFGSTQTQVSVLPKPATPILSHSGKICAGETLVFNIAPVSGSNVSYEWFFNGQSLGSTTQPNFSINNFSANDVGNYSVSVRVNNCLSNISNAVTVALVQSPVPLVASNSTLNAPACEGEQVQFFLPSVLGATYLWNGPGGFMSSEQNPILQSATVAQSGSYGGSVTIDGCAFSVTPTTATINPNPVQPILSNNGPLCETSPAVLTVTNGFPAGAVFSWFDGQGSKLGQTSSPSFTLNTPQSGNYTVSVAIGGCSSPASAVSNLKVDVIPNQQADIAGGAFAYACNTSRLMKATPPLQGSGVWGSLTPGLTFVNPNLPETTLSNISAPVNFITWTLSNGTCGNYDADTIRIIHESNIEATDDNFTIAAGQSLVDGDIADNDNTLNIEDWDLKIAEPPVYGTAEIVGDRLAYTPRAGYNGPDEMMYQICSDNCPGICAIATVRFSIEGDKIFIPNVISPNGDFKNDVLEIPALSGLANHRLCVFNRYGNLILDAAPYNNDWDGTWNEQDLPAGTYFVILYPDKNDEKNTISQYITIVR